MGDLEYLTTQEFNGNITRLQGEINAVGNTLTHTASGGKDAYILVAKIIPSGFIGASSTTGSGTITSTNSTEAKISANAVEIDRVTVGMATKFSATGQGLGVVGAGGSGYGALTDGIFHAAVGSKVTTGLDIEIENTLDNGNCRAQMVILEVDTGVSPSLLAQDITVEATLTSTGLLAGDVAFLAKKEFDGKLITVTGTRSGSGAADVVSITANTGKDLYLAQAKFSLEGIDSMNTSLIVNGITVESTKAELVTANQNQEYQYNVKGVKVLAGEIITIRNTTSDNSINSITGTLVCWEEDTGDDPLG